MATLWEYLPRYSTTDATLPKGDLAYTFHLLDPAACIAFSASMPLNFNTPLVNNNRSLFRKMALYTFFNAATGNKNLLFLRLGRIHLLSSGASAGAWDSSSVPFFFAPGGEARTPPPLTMQFTPLVITYGVKVRMKAQILTPGMQHGGNATGGTQPFFIPAEL